MPRTSVLRKSGLAAAAASALIAIGVPLALAAPTSAPPSDAGGYVDSTAHCAAPGTAVLFGATKTARVAICKTSSGYQYRGVRVSDGAKLIIPASKTSSDTFMANNDGVTYTVTPTALSVTANGNTFRTETWTDYHGPQAPATAGSGTSSAATPATTGVYPDPGAKASSPSASSGASAVQPSSAAPLPPPLPAEAGGGTSSGE